MLVSIPTVSLKQRAPFIKYQEDVLSRAAILGFGADLMIRKLRASIRFVFFVFELLQFSPISFFLQKQNGEASSPNSAFNSRWS